MDNLHGSGMANHAGFGLVLSAAPDILIPSASVTMSAPSAAAGSNNSGSSSAIHNCTICQQIFHCKADLQAHTQHVHRGLVAKPYRCQTCEKCFANASYLSQHQRIHLGLKPYRCQLCDRRFTQLCHLQQHMRTHTGEKPYGCRHAGCTKSFSQLSNLQSHQRSHMHDHPFRCHSCYKCFSDEASLRDHIPRHNATKHLKTKICTVCGKSYAQETYLARHMAKHAGSNGNDPGSGYAAAPALQLPSFPLPTSAAVSSDRLFDGDLPLGGLNLGDLHHVLLSGALHHHPSFQHRSPAPPPQRHHFPSAADLYHADGFKREHTN